MAQSNNSIEDASSDPDYIRYLFDPKEEYNCYFVVGNPTLQTPERIGVVKKMLLAHSIILRLELKDSKIKEEGEVPVIDIDPDTFKNLLRYVYGYDNTAALCFDEADNLLYAAEKYMMTNLKNKLALHLMSLLDYSNICGLMNNPACYSVLELNSAITEILHNETDKVLSSPQFLGLSSGAFLKILEQDILDVPEIELWRAAIMWAKGRVPGHEEDGQLLRNELSSHLQYIRVCTLTAEDLCNEVVPTKVLSYDEVILVCQSCKSGEIQPNLSTICNTIEERQSPFITSELLTETLHNASNSQNYGSAGESKLELITLDSTVILCSIELHSTSTHQCNCTVTIAKGTDEPIVVRFNEQVSGSQLWNIPVVTNGENVQLLPNCSYMITFTFSCSQIHESYHHYCNRYGKFQHHCQCQKVDNNKHFIVQPKRQSSNYYINQVNRIWYKTRDRRRKAKNV